MHTSASSSPSVVRFSPNAPQGSASGAEPLAPEAVVLARVAVDRLVGAAVHAQVGLRVAVEVVAAQRDAPGTGLLKIPVRTTSPRQTASRGVPTFTETSFTRRS